MENLIKASSFTTTNLWHELVDLCTSIVAHVVSFKQQAPVGGQVDELAADRRNDPEVADPVISPVLPHVDKHHAAGSENFSAPQYDVLLHFYLWKLEFVDNIKRLFAFWYQK